MTESQASEVTEASVEQPEVTESADSEVEGSTEQVEESTEQASESFTSTKIEDLPIELQQKYREMQGDYTRKMQELGEKGKKAELYDQLVNEQMVQQKFPEPAPEASPETTDYLAEALKVDTSTLDSTQRQQLEMLAKVVDAAVDKRVTEKVTPLQQEIRNRDYKQELAEVKKKYPDFDKYTDGIRGAMQGNQQLTFEQAYQIASYNDAIKKGRSDALKNLEVKKQQATPKTTSATKANERMSTFEEIVGWAKGKVA